MGLVLDGIVLITFALCIFLSARRGFIRTLIEGVGYVISVVVAYLVSTPIAEFIFDNAAAPYLNKTLTALFIDKSSEALSDLPASIEWIMRFSSISNEELTALVENSISDAVEMFVSSSRPFVTDLLQVMLFAMITVAIMFIARFIAVKVNKKCKESSLAKTNRILGGMVGAVKGLVFSVIFSFFVSVCILFSDGGFWFITEEALESSYICRYILDGLSALL